MSSETDQIWRGGRKISRAELRASLAVSLRLEHVGVFLGAGASLGAGGKTMAGLWKDFLSKHEVSLQFLQSEGFVESNELVAAPNVEELIDDVSNALREWRRLCRLQLFRQTEFAAVEAVFGEDFPVDHDAGYVGDAPDPLQPRGWEERADKLACALADLKRAVLNAALLPPEFWMPEEEDSDRLDFQKLRNHTRLLRKLTAARQPGQAVPWVFTTNYDLAVEFAAEELGLQVNNGFSGLHRRRFAAHNFDLGFRNTVARGEARFGTYSVRVAKLHGSLTWLEEGGQLVERSADHVRAGIDEFLSGSGENAPSPATMVYPSAAKYSQTIGFVFGELVRRFTEFLSQQQTCLIVSGYSCSDEHLNRVLDTALLNPTLQLFIYLPELNEESYSLPEWYDLSRWMRKLINLELPNVTLVGGGKTAYFDKLVNDLPDPALYDDQLSEMRERVQKEVSARRASGGGEQ